ncbi:MAG TPA: methyltransferase domain-containing protein [Vicinamibacterales bacterium]|nr:methyltransferase domain-containing protein [Vicinamibacterales bacterium]
MTPNAWIDRVIERHTASMTRPEFLKAVRALSARYVEQRASLIDRSPLDSAGKRAAFAAFYSPLHFLAVRAIIRSLGATGAGPRTIVDLGCGAGVASAAWAIESGGAASIVGIDLNPWVLEEARWNWSALGVRGRTRRGDLVAALEEAPDGAAVSCGWGLNELDKQARERAITALLSRARTGSPILIVEPLATRAVPWWPGFAASAAAHGARLDEWKLDLDLPPALAELDEAAGFRRDSFNARSAAFGVS